MLIGALEAGGTKMVCALGKEDGTHHGTRSLFRPPHRKRRYQRSQHTSKIRGLKRWALVHLDLWE